MILWILFGCLIIYAYLCKRFGVVHFLIRKWYTFKLVYTAKIALKITFPLNKVIKFGGFPIFSNFCFLQMLSGEIPIQSKT